MLIDLWEKFRGYDKWAPAHATVRTVEDGFVEVPYSKGVGSYLVKKSLNLVVWLDASGTEHKALFTVGDGSRFYEIKGEESLDIRLCPFNSDGYYCRELFQAAARRGFFNFAVVVAAIGLIAFLVWARS